MKCAALGSLLLAMLLANGAAYAAEEPFGEDFDGWRSTQAGQNNGSVNCRAILGNNLMSRSTNGATYVSTTSPIAKGNYEGSTVTVAGNAEMVNATSGGVGGRLLFYVDQYVLEQIASNGGYAWSVSVGGNLQSGYVQFNNSTISALERIMECVSANGG